MVIRVVRSLVAARDVGRMHDRIRRLETEIRSAPGCVQACAGRQVLADSRERIVLVSVWRNLDALYAWLGGRDLLNSPIRGADHLFREFDVQHFELLGAAGEDAATVEASAVVGR